MALLIETRNTASQTVLEDGLINIGPVVSRYCRKTEFGLPNFSTTTNGITLNGQGIYKVTASFVASGTVAGDIRVDALVDGQPIGAFSVDTETVPDTTQRTLYIQFNVKVDKACVLNCWSIVPKTISFQNTGVGATFILADISVVKEV